MGLEEFSISELGSLITVSSGAVATILFALSRSKCSKLSCCGCMCERPVEAIMQQAPEDADEPRLTGP